MASIAYVSDEKMLEFHRINGNKTIAFWRTSNKRFSDFALGDLLFFLAKGNRKEKGVVGYGQYIGSKSMTISAFWNTYQEFTGYVNKFELVKSIDKTNKNERRPQKINCLLLENVVFFKFPIYLSELGINLSNNLESYTYLDKEDGHVTLQLLEKVKEIGVDDWANIISNDYKDEESFNNQIIKCQIATLFENMNIGFKINESLANDYFNEYGQIWINNKHNAFINFDGGVKLYYLFNSSIKDIKQNFIKLVGEINYIKLSINDKLEIIVLSPINFTDDQNLILEKLEVNKKATK